MLYAGHDQAIAALWRDTGSPSAEMLAELAGECRLSGRPLASLLVERRFVERRELIRRVAALLGLELVADPPESLAEELVALLPADLAWRCRVVPWRVDARSLAVLAADPFNPGTAGALGFALGREVRLAVADPASVARLLRRHYAEAPGGGAPAGAGGADVPIAGGGDPTAPELERMAAETPVVGLVDRVLSEAIRDRASDVHFEPFDGEFKVRSRVDGVLRDAAVAAPALALPVISRLKVLAGLNIAERRVPQDGRLPYAVDGRPVDLRISTLPTQTGESVVLRVLDAGAAPHGLDGLGLPAALETELREVIGRPHGCLIVTGPTGCGKTTTLYGCLRIINQPAVKILTAEDPVEYEIDGVMQLPVNPAIGLTFATALRSFLRQDPDVLMVGEIRDLETAQIAVQAALTGHLVLSTLHTNDAAGAITRLIDMGVEPYLLCATVEAVLAQRLVRRICPACREAAGPDAVTPPRSGPQPATPAAGSWQRGRGCPACRHTGYQGRFGVFEWLRMNGRLRALVLQGAPAAAVKAAAVGGGMQTLRAAGLRAAAEGHTTLDEVAAYT